MSRVARLLTTLLALTLFAANSASAITTSLAEKPASGLFGSLEQRVGIDALASAGRIDEKLSLRYDFASDFPVAARTGGQLLYRYRNGPETVTRLARGAADAQAKIGVHGVSVTTNPITGRACGVACREAVEKVFPVVKTGADPNHFTVVLPNPVTREVADQFNALFQAVP